MVIDTSALVAILCLESEASAFATAIEQATVRFISAATLFEAAIVLEKRFGPIGGSELDLFIAKAGIDVVPVSLDQVEIAREAYRRFGRGRVRLNFGDCFSYALARSTDEPLLFKGNDFERTDVQPAFVLT